MAKKKVSKRREASPREMTISSLRTAAGASREADELVEKAHMALADVWLFLDHLASEGDSSASPALKEISYLMKTIGEMRQELGSVVWKIEEHILPKLG